MTRSMQKSLLLALTVIVCCCLCQSHQQATSSASTDPPQSISSLLRETALRQPAPLQQQRLITTTTEQPLAASGSPVGTRVPSVVLATTTTIPATSNSNAQPITTTASPATTTTVNIAPTAPANQFQYVRPLAGKCQYNNQTYAIGQKWNDDCLHVCECVLANDVPISACRARCPTYKDLSGDKCSLQRSKSDECCLEWVCEPDANATPSVTTTVMQTEGGQLNVSTTEIRMPMTRTVNQAELLDQATGGVTTAATVVTTTTAAPVTTQRLTTTTTFAPTTTRPTAAAATTTTTVRQPTFAANQQQDATVQPRTISSSNNRQLGNRQNQVPTTTSASITTTAQPPPTTTTTSSSRQSPTKPKNSQTSVAGSRGPKQIPSSSAERPQILTTQSASSLPPPQSLVTTISSLPDSNDQPQATSGNRASRLYPVATSPPQTTTESESNLDQPADEVDPTLVDLCIQEEDKAFKLNLTWQVEPCNQTCRCVFRNEPRDPTIDVNYYPTSNLKIDSLPTEIRCSLPPQCQSVMSMLVPSADCPRPHLVLPQRQNTMDRCICPQISCSATEDQPKQPTRIQPATMTTSPPRGCRLPNGRMLSFNEIFRDECHATCRCSPDGEIRCEQLRCEQPVDVLCAEWIPEPDFKQNSTENRCCPQFICKKPALVDPSQTLNEISSTTISSATSSSSVTPTTTASITPAPDDVAELALRSCTLLGKEVPHGQQVPEEIQPRDACGKICACHDGKIVCHCPPVDSQPPDDLDCPPGSVHQTTDECCTRWACQIEEPYALRNFSINPINSTNVEMSFYLPVFAVGKRGNFKLNYTGYPISLIEADRSNDQSESSAPPNNAKWQQRSNISTNDGVFSSQLIKYFLGQLKPEHKYWFKVLVYFDEQEAPFDGPMEGPLRSVIMPSTPRRDTEVVDTSASTTTLKTTTTAVSTTKVPTILLPVHRNTNPPIVSLPPTTTTANLIPTTSTTTTTTTTTTRAPTTSSPPSTHGVMSTSRPEITKPGVESPEHDSNWRHNPPCNHIETSLLLPWTEQFQSQINGPIQKHAWYLLVALSIVTVSFVIVLYLYVKKSSRHVIAPITSHQSAYDNPTFTKLVSYYANQPHVLLVDENNQNFNNDIILAKQKNLEVDKSSPLNQHQQSKNNSHNHLPAHMQHQINDIHHHNGRQHLI